MGQLPLTVTGADSPTCAPGSGRVRMRNGEWPGALLAAGPFRLAGRGYWVPIRPRFRRPNSGEVELLTNPQHVWVAEHVSVALEHRVPAPGYLALVGDLVQAV